MTFSIFGFGGVVTFGLSNFCFFVAGSSLLSATEARLAGFGFSVFAGEKKSTGFVDLFSLFSDFFDSVFFFLVGLITMSRVWNI